LSQLYPSPPARAIAVAGGGIIGLSIAWRLAQRGFRVAVFERSSPGQEASWAGAGMLAPGGEFDSSSDVTALAIESRSVYLDFVRELHEATQVEIDYQDCGALDLAYEPAAWQALQRRADRQATLGILSRPLTLDRIKAFWPRVRLEGLQGALFYPGDAVVNPRELLISLVAACRKLGVEFFEMSPIESVEMSAGCASVRTAAQVSNFEAVVIAAGAWSSSIELQGVPKLPESVPVKGHLIGFRQPGQTCNTILRRGHSYLFQRANGLLVCGASVERVGWDRSVDPAIAASLARDAGVVLPHLAETTPSEAWIGFRPDSDSLHLGQWHSRRLYLAYGHYRNGILLAPVTARNIAREISASLEKQ